VLFLVSCVLLYKSIVWTIWGWTMYSQGINNENR
jgi:hypothetical protein